MSKVQEKCSTCGTDLVHIRRADDKVYMRCPLCICPPSFVVLSLCDLSKIKQVLVIDYDGMGENGSKKDFDGSNS